MSVAIRKLGKAAKKRLKRYNKAQDVMYFHNQVGDLPMEAFANPPKMDLDLAENIYFAGGKRVSGVLNKPKTRKRRKKGRGSLPLRK
jgi:hypothetical protein|tara:strand:+ start:138 stop:398 length:261 start_codon:yes stop_codon:yes gene_type:complete